ncbi:PepSY-associated TM helix domain-containing protein [Henriciella aquimarina]|uniref:PepSY-associated TM helix domain-containing protein n=1 Tax=Henriciella aquimarina TaxID=545261 RepID=UPI001F3CCB7E|nr:PepSY-associated TM helix domain-containing protein [Henriciella aquimarina]
MKNGLRQSMAWLHTWSGLLLGWLLFAIFLTGTVAYFRQEITVWMQPETHHSIPGPDSAAIGMEKLAEIAPEAETWSISLPNERGNTLDVGWRNPDDPPGRRGGHRETLDAGTGDVIDARETAGGNFLYRFHFELHALPRNWARWIVGVATFFMFIAIISGIITHKRIFKDFFTFRPRKGQRSWLDMHNVTAVMALPFHLMITYSGLLLFMSTIMPFAVEGRHRGPPPDRGEAAIVEVQRDARPLTDVTPLLQKARTEWGQAVGRITIYEPSSPDAMIELAPLRNHDLTSHSGSGSNGVERMTFDGHSGELLESTTGRRNDSVVTKVNNTFGTLHRARFADTGLRWIFFFAGVAGTVMVGTGLSLWVSKRAVKNAKAGKASLGFRLVERLNAGSVAGLSLAVTAYFWANRLIPAGVANRADWEINSFLIVWALAAVYAFLRPVARAWIEIAGATAILLIGLPVLNMVVTDSHLFWSVPHGQWIVAGFDIMALLTGICFAYAAWVLTHRKAAPSHARKRPAEAPARAVASPAEGH